MDLTDHDDGGGAAVDRVIAAWGEAAVRAVLHAIQQHGADAVQRHLDACSG